MVTLDHFQNFGTPIPFKLCLLTYCSDHFHLSCGLCRPLITHVNHLNNNYITLQYQQTACESSAYFCLRLCTLTAAKRCLRCGRIDYRMGGCKNEVWLWKTMLHITKGTCGCALGTIIELYTTIIFITLTIVSLALITAAFLNECIQ